MTDRIKLVAFLTASDLQKILYFAEVGVEQR